MTLARVLLVLAAAGALAFYVGPYRSQQQDEERLAKIAAAIAGRDVGIDCPGTLAALTEVAPHDGSVAFAADGRPADEAKLSNGTCSRLRSLLAGEVDGLECLALVTECDEELERTAVAVNVLSHEAWHLAGERDEAAAQCLALQTNAETAVRLGASPAEAYAISIFILREIQPALPPDYRTSDCYDGGPLDLRPASEGWPAASLAPPR